MWALLILIVSNIIFTLILFRQIKKEQVRNRVLQAFLAGILRSISDYCNVNDRIDPSEAPELNTKLPIPYKKVLESIEYEFRNDYLLDPFQKWIKDGRQIFVDEKYANEGFNYIYFDFFDKIAKQWFSGELLSEKDKEFLRNDIVVTDKNVEELRGEIAMFKDLLAGELDSSNFKKESLGNQILFMFNHIKIEHREKLKQEILKRMN